jgi:glucan biosynthesis protein C
MPDADHKPVRHAFLDAARSALMLLGVVYHASVVYAVNSDWLIVDPSADAVFGWLAAGIHLFRMPAFFFVAGVLGMMMLQRRGPRGFLRNRALRLLVPLASTAFLVNTILYVYLAGSPANAGSLVLQALDGGAALEFAISRWLAHLWFLVDLMSCSGIAAGLWWLAGRPPSLTRPTRPFPQDASGWQGLILLLLLPLVHMCLVSAASLTRPFCSSILWLTTPSRIAWAFSFFGVGMLAGLSPVVFRRLTTLRWSDVALLCVAVSAPAWLKAGHPAPRFVVAYVAALATWLAVVTFLGLFARMVTRRSEVFSYLSDASYSVYLFHLVIVVVTGTLLHAVAWPYALKFVIVLVASAVIPLTLHHFVVLRFSAVRFLFNGRRA